MSQRNDRPRMTAIYRAYEARRCAKAHQALRPDHQISGKVARWNAILNMLCNPDLGAELADLVKITAEANRDIARYKELEQTEGAA